MVTSVFLWAVWRGGDGDGVKHTAVLPSVVWITDTLHLVAARLRDGEEKCESEHSTFHLIYFMPDFTGNRKQTIIKSCWGVGCGRDRLTPWWEQMREVEDPGQVLRLKVVTGRQRRSKHIMFGPHGVPSST